LFEASSFHDLASLPPLSQHFALFTAFDLSEVTDDEMLSMARLLLRRGLACVSCWGEDCERLHNAFDVERVEIDLDNFDDDAEEHPNVVMTTWHDGEPLTDALMFFGRLAIPTLRYSVNCFV
jgi:hypothetical protein